MNEVGINLDGHRSKPVSEYLGKISAQHVIIVCELAEQSCPSIWPFALKTIRWPLDDPAAEQGTEDDKLKKFRTMRDTIEERIIQWINSDDSD